MESLTDEELLRALRRGIITKLEGIDDKPTHYAVIDFCDTTDDLLICYGSVGWHDGETSYSPHVIKGCDKNKTWRIND